MPWHKSKRSLASRVRLNFVGDGGGKLPLTLSANRHSGIHSVNRLDLEIFQRVWRGGQSNEFAVRLFKLRLTTETASTSVWSSLRGFFDCLRFFWLLSSAAVATQFNRDNSGQLQKQQKLSTSYQKNTLQSCCKCKGHFQLPASECNNNKVDKGLLNFWLMNNPTKKRGNVS